MIDTTKDIVYFRHCGEINTEQVLGHARIRCAELGIDTLVIASETGRSALQALALFRGTGVRLVVVTHVPATTVGPKGEIPIGLARVEYTPAREALLGAGVTIVQGTRPFAPPSRSVGWTYPTPEAMVDKTLDVLGAGTKIAIEVALMATDAGEVEEGQEVVSCAGTYKGLDTALVVCSAHSLHFFREFEVREIIARPRYRVRKLPEYGYENWKGDLDAYYRQAGRTP